MEFRNGIIVVTEERFCPIYNVGDEFNVLRDALTIPGVKPTCLILVRQILRITEGQDALKRHSVFGAQKVKFECGGCSGLIRFEFKKEKGYATSQMKLLASQQKRAANKELSEFTGMLKTFPIVGEPRQQHLQIVEIQVRSSRIQHRNLTVFVDARFDAQSRLRPLMIL